MAVQPKILTIPFARDATPDLVNEIPDDPNPLVPQSASWEQGFPYVTMIPLVSGGISPQGQDFNGIMKAISEHTVFQGAGGVYKFDADVVAAGGYGIGAVLLADDGLSLWVSTANGNVEDFNTGTPTQWRKISQGVPQTVNGETTNTSTSEGHTHAVSAATENLAGVAEIATTSESRAMSDDNRIVTPKKLGDVFMPVLTGTASLTGSNNQIVMTGIVSELALEIGDVIQLIGGGGNNGKLHTVESITNGTTIVVNYEHCGSRGNGSLKLFDYSGSITVKRIAKWFNAATGVGQKYVLLPGRTSTTNYTNDTGRSIFVSLNVQADNTTSPAAGVFFIDGSAVVAQDSTYGGTSLARVSFIAKITPGSTYRYDNGQGTIISWLEQR